MISSAQMRGIERAAIEGGLVSGLTLMERAASATVDAVLDEWPLLAAGDDSGADPTDPPQALLLCGPGSNGGDGFAVARLFRNRGWAVQVLFFGHPDRLPPDARQMWQRWQAMGSVLDWTAENARSLADRLTPRRPFLVVDALFGIGLSRPLDAGVTKIWQSFCDLAAPRFAHNPPCLCAVDLPSGLSDDAPDGRRLTWFDDPHRPCLTVTFHAAKLAHRAMLAAGERLRVVDLGLGDAAGATS